VRTGKIKYFDLGCPVFVEGVYLEDVGILLVFGGLVNSTKRRTRAETINGLNKKSC